MSFWLLFLADLKSMLRNRMALFWFLAFPVIFILIFGAVFSGGQQPQFSVGLVFEPGDPMGLGFAEGLRQVKAFRVHTGSLQQELAALKKGDRALAIEVPAGAGAAALAGSKTTVPVHYDQGREQTSRMLLPVVDELLLEAERRVSGRPRLLEARLQPVQTSPLKAIDFILPGILAMALMQLGFFGSFQMVVLREQKVLKALGATPLPRHHVLGAEVLVRLLLSLVQMSVTIAIGVLVFRLHVTGDWLAVLGVVVLGALTFTSLGYLLTCRARTIDSGQGLVQLVQFPMMFLSGIFFPISIMPAFLKPVAAALPLTYLGDALRQVMVGMAPDHALATCLATLTGWLLVSLALATALWRWE